MSQRQISDIAASVRQRLLNRSRETGRPFDELLQYFAIERFLYRLSESPHSAKFVLKGAAMFAVWRAPLSRPTRDIDLLGKTNNEVNDLVQIVRDICVQDVQPDGLLFYADSAEGQRIIEAAAYEGLRVRFDGSLGTARVRMQVDVGFGDIIVPGPSELEYPTILDFPAPRLRGYSRESLVAEKFEAMTRLGFANSRMKDFFDMWLVASEFDFDGETLAEAIKQTFAHRQTDMAARPAALTMAFAAGESRQALWTAFVSRRLIAGAPTGLPTIIEVLIDFLLPVAEALAVGKKFSKRWHAGGPWV